MIVAAFISDRRDLYLPACQRTFWSHVPHGVIRYFNIIDDRHHELGMAGAVKKAWQWAWEIGADYLFHVEEDFVFHQPVPIGEMKRTLERNAHLAQVLLKRQPWSPEEIQAGGFIELNPAAFVQKDGFVEHDVLFSLNPCLIPRRTLAVEWSPTHPGGAERSITEACQDVGLKFAYYGRLEDKPLCEHIGRERATEGWRW